MATHEQICVLADILAGEAEAIGWPDTCHAYCAQNAESGLNWGPDGRVQFTDDEMAEAVRRAIADDIPDEYRRTVDDDGVIPLDV